MPGEQVRLGFVGFGEVGSSFAKGFRAAGLATMAAYDIAAFDGTFSELIQRRAGETAVELVRSPAELAARTDYIIAVTPGDQSTAAASAIVSSLDKHHVYIDFAATTPRIKEAVGEILAPSGAQAADGGIMGFPLRDLQAVSILASGPGAQKFFDAMMPWGMNLEVVGPKLGSGSGIKILRSVMTKGLEALAQECALASSRYGIFDQVFGSMAKMMDAHPFMEHVALLLTTGVIHDGRRTEEMEMSTEALEEIGIEPIMTRSIADRLRLVAQAGLKEHFAGEVPSDYRVAVAALEKFLPSASKV